MSRILSALALSAALVLGGCQNPDGSTDWGSTLLLGAGIGVGAALLAGAASDGGGSRHHAYGHRRPPPRYAYGHRGYHGHAYDHGGYRGGW